MSCGSGLISEKDMCQIWWKEARADEIVAHYVTDTSIEPYKDAKILCIQDFGSEPLEAVSMGNRMNVLRYLLEWRGDHSDRLTLITSNLSFEKIKVWSNVTATGWQVGLWKCATILKSKVKTEESIDDTE